MRKKIISILLVCLFMFPTVSLAYENSSYSNNIRIGLESVMNTQLNIKFNGNFSFNGTTIASGTSTVLSIANNKIVFMGNSYDELNFTPSSGQNTMGIQAGSYMRNYQGTMKFKVYSEQILPINTLNIEDYLKGVVAYEMADYFHIEALKAQAIAARNYALANRGRYDYLGYDLNDTVACQVYRGYNSKFTNVNQAVEETRGLVLLYNESLVNAYFSSSNGGYTEASENVWSSRVDYLKSKPDPFDIRPWPVTDGKLIFTSKEIDEKLKSKGILNSSDSFLRIDLGSIQRYASGRVSNITIVYKDATGKEVTKSFSKESARTFLSLPSAMYYLAYDSSSDTYTFTGKGYGHGIGMSQWGAQNRALGNQNFEQILTFYYDKTYLTGLSSTVKMTSIATDKLSPQPMNNQITITAKASGSSNILYRFWIHDGVDWKVVQNYSSSNAYKWIPLKGGSYKIWVDAKDRYSNKDVDNSMQVYYTVNNVSASLSTDKASPQSSKTTVKVTAGASGTGSPLYRFWIHDGSSWKVVQNYSTNSIYNWTPASTGNYRIWVDVKDANSTKDVDAVKEISYSIKDTANMTSLVTDKASPSPVNNQITITAKASGSSNVLYRFWIHDGSSWKVVQNYSSNSIYKWTPVKSGGYKVWVDAKDKNSSNDVDSYKQIYYTVNNVSASLSTDKASPQPSKTTVKVTAGAGGTGSPLYRFWIHDGYSWKVVQDYSTNSVYNWTPASTGNYRIWVDVKDANSTKDVDAVKEISYSIKDTANMTSLVTDKASPSPVNNQITITAKASGSSNVLYRFWIHDGYSWKVVQNYSSSSTYRWTPVNGGSYKIWVDAKDKNSKNDVDSYKQIYYKVNNVSASLSVDKASPQPSKTAIRVTAGASGSSSPLYRFWVHDGYSWKVVQDYSTNRVYNWTPARTGNYRIWVDVKDAKSTKDVDAVKEIYYTIKDTANMTSLVTDKPSPQPMNNQITITAKASGSSNVLYRFWIHDGYSWKVVQNYSSSNTYKWIPVRGGSYKIWVDAKDKNSSNDVDSYKQIYYTVNNVSASLSTDKASPQPSKTTVKVTAGAGGTVSPLYRFWIHDGYSWKVVQNYSTNRVYSWTPTSRGSYKIWVDVKDSRSTKDVDAVKEIYYTIR